MATSSAFTPKASLTEAPTNLKEAIDWVLRVTGKDGKALSNGECICGLAAAVTDLLQSVELEYNGYQGENKGTEGADSTGKNNGATSDKVKEHLNGLFSLVQGLGGTAVVRTYIDQLAQVLSALVGWSKIEQCGNGCGGDDKPHGKERCEYLAEIEPKNKCDTCGCMKWEVPGPKEENKGHHLGRGCLKCDGDKCGKPGAGGCTCKCNVDGTCSGLGADACKCDRKCGCTIDTYRSAYSRKLNATFIEVGIDYNNPSTWKDLLIDPPGMTTNGTTASQRRHHCARIFLGSVCLIWSGLTYMYWTGKYHSSSPRWNNHILDGSGLDDGTLSQWLQALGFPREMLNNHGPQNRLDKVIWDGFSDKLLLGFAVPSGLLESVAKDDWGNTARRPTGMNYPGLVHTIHRDSFNTDAIVFPQNGTGSSTTDTNQHKNGAIFKLYILSCAYFTGLQKKDTPKAENRTPKTIREILYWLSALPYSQAYQEIVKHAKSELEKASPTEKKLSFKQDKRPAPITVDEYNLFAHFQAVTQYCPLVLIGIQGGIHSSKDTDSTNEPPIHSLYSNSHFSFTYPTVSIQAYNQVVHYIRALFYQLYFLRKQCAVKVTCGGKWRECRYGSGVLGKGVISWMCLGCDPMEHDRKSRVDKVNGEILKGVKEWKDENQEVTEDSDCAKALKELLGAIGEVVVQLGNAQERLDRGNPSLEGVRKALNNAVPVDRWQDKFINVLKAVLGEVEKKVTELEKVVEKKVNGLEKEVKRLEDLMKKVNRQEILGEAKTKLEKAKDALKTAKEAVTKAKNALTAAKNAFPGNSNHVDPCKNIVSASIDGLHKALEILKEAVQQIIDATNNDITKLQDAILKASDTADVVGEVDKQQAAQKVTLYAYSALLTTIDQLISICNSPKCHNCGKHSKKCGQPSTPSICRTCLQPTTTGVPSPLQAFLEDRLPGFSCSAVVNQEKEQPDYPLAASHSGHCNGSGQCCPLPMGFRNQFHEGSTGDCTGHRLYGILYFFSNGDMMQSCVYTLVRVTAALSATTPQVLGDVFGFFRGGVGNPVKGENQKGEKEKPCDHTSNPSESSEANKSKYFCGWCASGLRDEVQKIDWIPNGNSTPGGHYMDKVGKALRDIKGEKDASSATPSALSSLTKDSEYLSPLTGELYTAVSATFGHVYLSWVLYLSDALEGGLKSLSEAFQQIECRGCKGNCDPNKCKKGSHGSTAEGSKGTPLCQCQSIVSCTGVLPVLYRHGFSYGNPFNLEGYQQKEEEDLQFDIKKEDKSIKQCHQFLDSLQDVIKKKDTTHPLTELLKQVGQLQYDIRLPWIFVLTLAWLVAVLYLAFGAIWPLDWSHMRSHWLRGGAHQWQCMWYKVMTGRKGMELVEYFGKT